MNSNICIHFYIILFQEEFEFQIQMFGGSNLKSCTDARSKKTTTLTAALFQAPKEFLKKNQYNMYVALRHFPEIKFRLLLCHCVSSVSSDILIEYKWHSSQHISQLFIENLYFVANNLSLLHNNVHLEIIVLLCYIVSHYFP